MVVKIITELGLAMPPANSVDREAHAARIALLAKDCADLPIDHLREAAEHWRRTRPFLPRACELREETLALARMAMRGRELPPPPAPPPPPKPVAPPLTADEISRLPRAIVSMGVKLGEIDPAVLESIENKE